MDGVQENQGWLSTGPGMHPWGLLSYPWVQPWDRSKLSLGPVCTHYRVVQRSDDLCISPKIKNNQPLEMKSDELYTCWKYFVNEQV